MILDSFGVLDLKINGFTAEMGDIIEVQMDSTDEASMCRVVSFNRKQHGNKITINCQVLKADMSPDKRFHGTIEVEPGQVLKMVHKRKGK